MMCIENTLTQELGQRATNPLKLKIHVHPHLWRMRSSTESKKVDGMGYFRVGWAKQKQKEIKGSSITRSS